MLQIVGSEAGALSDAGRHLWADLLAVVKHANTEPGHPLPVKVRREPDCRLTRYPISRAAKTSAPAMAAFSVATQASTPGSWGTSGTQRPSTSSSHSILKSTAPSRLWVPVRGFYAWPRMSCVGSKVTGAAVATRPVDRRVGRRFLGRLPWFAEGSAYCHGSPGWRRVEACPGR